MLRILRTSLIALGCIALVFLLLGFTDIPYYAYHSLGTSHATLKESPRAIVLLGGSGMPSPEGLMRCYHAYANARLYPKARIIIAHPRHPVDSIGLYQSYLMAHELIIRGVDSLRISYEAEGNSTHTQA
ncbi:MAG: hypothetical protein MUF42_08410 [Cytophagaceae bacterium]|nr:hypothetical protein [Cytophagaceae bacterium]